MPYTTDLARDLAKYLSSVATVLQSDAPLSRALRGVLAGALVDAKQREPFATLIEKRREPVLKRLKVAWPRSKDSEIGHMADLLFGPILYRVLIRQVQVDARLARILVMEALESKQG